MKDAEEEAAGESGEEGDEETKSESPPPAEPPVARKTHQQTLKELAQKKAPATPTGSQEVSSSEKSESSGVQALEKTPPQFRGAEKYAACKCQEGARPSPSVLAEEANWPWDPAALGATRCHCEADRQPNRTSSTRGEVGVTIDLLSVVLK